jgi:RHS repeat-associated protein
MTVANRLNVVILALATLFAPGPLFGQTQEQVVYFHTDAAGSVRAVTDANGQEVERHDYLPFGEPYPADPEPTERRLFAGKERDHETKFEYFGGRYYASSSGRFTTVDPVLDNTAALIDPQRWNRYTYVRNNPLRYTDPDGRVLDTIIDVLSVAYDAFDIGQTIYRGEDVSGAQIGAFAADVAGVFIPFATGGGAAVRAASRAADAAEGAKAGVEVVQRAMSRAELKATQETGLLRGGREGTHFVSDAVNTNAKRAQQRLALPKAPEVRVTMEVPAGTLSPPQKVRPKNGMPGGGTERTGTGRIPVRILKVDEFGYPIP